MPATVRILLLLSSLLLALYAFWPRTVKPMASLQPLKFLTVAARAKHTATVIFVHVGSDVVAASISLILFDDRDLVTLAMAGSRSLLC